MKHPAPFCLVAVLVASPVSAADDDFATLRKRSLAEEGAPPPVATVEDRSIKRRRNYPMQPPTIPHKIDGYQVDLHANKCLSCHSRSRSEESQAPMVSVTHFMDRDGNFLADVSPRRYFCEQCHVVQTDAKQAVESDFMDVDDLLKAGQAK
jgi:nitrate reductase cytochrome c-type subunit